jgi:hypothetical protein
MLDVSELKLLAEGLEFNNTVLGIHMLGNEAETNAAGFVDLCKDTVGQDFAHFSLFTRI